MSKRRPYIRPMDGWWKKNPFFIEYVIHESTAFFVLAYALTLLVGLVRLSQGETAWNAWLACLKTPLAVVFHVCLLAGVVYHAFSWFKLMPVTLPPIRIGGRKLRADEIVTGGLVAAVVGAVFVYTLVWGLA